MADKELHVMSVVLKSSRNPLLATMVERLVSRSVQITVVALDCGGPLAEQSADLGAKFHALRAETTRSVPVAVRRLLRLAAEVRPNVIHAHLFGPGLALAVASSRARNRFGTVITRHHNRLHHLSRQRTHVFLDGWSARRVSAVIAVSAAVRDTMVDLERVPATKVSVVHNGLDPAIMRTDPTAVEAWRKRLGPGPLLVASGRLSPEKDLATLLRAVAIASKQVPGLHLAVAGAGDAATMSLLRGDTEELGISAQVQLLGWVDDIQNLLSAADVFVHSSIDEAFSLTILEALMLGVPLAVTTTGGTKEAVEGFYPPIAAGDASALADQIVDRLTSPDARDVAVEAAAVTKQRFNPDTMISEHLDVYRSVAR